MTTTPLSPEEYAEMADPVRQDDLVVLVGLTYSMGDWARHELIKQDILIPRQNVYTMGDPHRLEGRRFTKAYVYDPIHPGQSLAVLDQREKGRRYLTYSALRTGERFEGFYHLMPNGTLRGPSKTL